MRVAPYVLEEIVPLIFSNSDAESLSRATLAVKLLRDHVEYVSLLSSSTISSDQINQMTNLMHQVHVQGNEIYSNCTFLTINSHPEYHYPEMIAKFGSPSNFNTILFEKTIKPFKGIYNWRQNCKKVVNVTLLKTFYHWVLVNSYFGSESKETSGNVVLTRRRANSLAEIITEKGLAIEKNYRYLVEIMNQRFIVKVRSMKRDASNNFEITCEYLYQVIEDIVVEGLVRPRYKLESVDPTMEMIPVDCFNRRVYLMQPSGSRTDWEAIY